MLCPRKLSLLAAALLAVTAQPSWAGLLPVSATVTPEDTNFRYTYGVVLTSDSLLKSGDYFTIFDFPSMVAGSAVMPDGWSMTSSNTGGNPGGTVPGDSTSLPNLKFTYNGPDLTGQMGLGNFSVVATNSNAVEQPYSFTGFTQRQVDGKNDSNVTETVVPSGEVIQPPPGDGGGTPGGGGDVPGVPEPATLLLLATGLPLARWLRNQRR